jgi:hypothetical protein
MRLWNNGAGQNASMTDQIELWSDIDWANKMCYPMLCHGSPHNHSFVTCVAPQVMLSLLADMTRVWLVISVGRLDTCRKPAWFAQRRRRVPVQVRRNRVINSVEGVHEGVHAKVPGLFGVCKWTTWKGEWTLPVVSHQQWKVNDTTYPSANPTHVNWHVATWYIFFYCPYVAHRPCRWKGEHNN